jgi:hypothetical protein
MTSPRFKISSSSFKEELHSPDYHRHKELPDFRRIINNRKIPKKSHRGFRSSFFYSNYHCRGTDRSDCRSQSEYRLDYSHYCGAALSLSYNGCTRRLGFESLTACLVDAIANNKTTIDIHVGTSHIISPQDGNHLNWSQFSACPPAPKIFRRKLR